MQIQVDIDDSIWDEYIRIGIEKREVEKIVGEALKKHISKIKPYWKLLDLEGKIEWEGNLDELRMVGN